jgi:hypothetical protein
VYLVARKRAVAASHAQVHIHDEQVVAIDEPRVYEVFLRSKHMVAHNGLMA